MWVITSEKTQPEFVSIVSKTPVRDDRNFAKKNNNMKHMFHFLGSWAGRKIPNVHTYIYIYALMLMLLMR